MQEPLIDYIHMHDTNPVEVRKEKKKKGSPAVSNGLNGILLFQSYPKHLLK